jgi:Dimerisation domain
MNPASDIPSADFSPSAAMLQIMTGFRVSRATYIAAKLGIADLLKDGPKSAEELAQFTDTHAPSLYRVMRALASVGYLVKTSRDVLHLPPSQQRSEAMFLIRCALWRS